MQAASGVDNKGVIPFFFKAVKYNGKTYIDGGCLKNFPLDLFLDKEGKTLAFDLVSNGQDKEQQIKSMKDFTMGFVNMMLLAANRVDTVNEKVTVVRVNTGNVSAFDFDIDSNKIQYLISAGYKAL